jgi:hypothetical protein
VESATNSSRSDRHNLPARSHHSYGVGRTCKSQLKRHNLSTVHLAPFHWQVSSRVTHSKFWPDAKHPIQYLSGHLHQRTGVSTMGYRSSLSSGVNDHRRFRRRRRHVDCSLFSFVSFCRRLDFVVGVTRTPVQSRQNCQSVLPFQV